MKSSGFYVDPNPAMDKNKEANKSLVFISIILIVFLQKQMYGEV